MYGWKLPNSEQLACPAVADCTSGIYWAISSTLVSHLGGGGGGGGEGEGVLGPYLWPNLQIVEGKHPLTTPTLYAIIDIVMYGLEKVKLLVYLQVQ